MSRFATLLMLLLLASTSHSQTWIQKANVPFDVGNSEGACFSITDKVYIAFGVTNNEYSSYCWEYNTAADSWSQKATCPACPVRWPCSFVINGKGYCFGGYDTCVGGTNNLWEYNPVNDSWLQKSSLPDSVRSGAVGFSINNKGYVVGGAYVFGVVTNDCWEYDPTTDSWTSKASMPCTGRTFGSGFAINSKGYVGLGTTYSQNLKDWWEYDPSTDSWQIRDSLPGNSQVAEGSSFSIGNYGYVGPGPYDFINQYSFFRYDAINDQWTQMPNFPGTQFWNCYSTSALGKGYIISGADMNTCIETTWEFTPPVGIEEFNAHSFFVYPNPATDKIFVTGENLSAPEINVTTFDISGQLIRTENISSSHNGFSYSRNGLKPGYYFLEISDESGIIGHIKVSFL